MGSPTDTMYFMTDLLLECGVDTWPSSAMFCSELELAQPFLNSKEKYYLYHVLSPQGDTDLLSQPSPNIMRE